MGPNGEMLTLFGALVLAGAVGGVLSLLWRDRRP